MCSNEGKPATGFGPPYALLQGRLPDMAEARVRGVPRAGSAAGRPRVQPAAPECTLGGSCILNHPLLCCPSAVAQAPPQEGLIEVKMGHACFIRDTKDFFIAYGDHPEWGTAHTVGRRTAAPGTGGRGRQAASAMQGAAQPSPCPLWRCLGSLIRWCCPAGTGVGPGGRVVCHRLYHLAAVEVRGRGLTRAGMLRRRWRALPARPARRSASCPASTRTTPAAASCSETTHPEFGTVMRMLKQEVTVRAAVEGDTTYSGLLGPMHYD